MFMAGMVTMVAVLYSIKFQNLLKEEQMPTPRQGYFWQRLFECRKALPLKISAA